MGPIGCPETSASHYHYSLRNDPEECSSQLLRDGSLKSRIALLIVNHLNIKKEPLPSVRSRMNYNDWGLGSPNRPQHQHKIYRAFLPCSFRASKSRLCSNLSIKSETCFRDNFKNDSEYLIILLFRFKPLILPSGIIQNGEGSHVV